MSRSQELGCVRRIRTEHQCLIGFIYEQLSVNLSDSCRVDMERLLSSE